MEVEQQINSKSTWDSSNFIQKLFFSYMYPLFWRGYKKNGLDIDDLFRCSKYDESQRIVQKLERNWRMERMKKKPKLYRSLIFTYWSYFIFPLFIFIIAECGVRIIQPILLGYVINFFSKSKEEPITYYDACLAAGGVCLCSVVYIILNHPTLVMVMRLGMRMRSACCTLMYKKSLKLSRASLGKTTVGQIVNLMSNDVNRFDEFATFVSYFFVAPIQTVIIVYIIYLYLGWSCFAGVGCLIFFTMFQAFMGKLFSKVRLSTAELTDSRLRLMNEIISGMRVIKMYSWEQPFADLVANARKLEVGRIRRACFLKAINLSIFFIASRVTLFACFVAYVLTGNQLTATGVFVTMALFNTLRVNLTHLFPLSIAMGAELLVSSKRIQTFLELEEIEVNSNNTELNDSDSSEMDKMSTGLIVDSITAKWNQDLSCPTLDDISLELKQGDLLAVIGPVGSGKSSFLMTILKELPLLSGSIKTEGTISYASQESWNFNSSVRNNILFGKPYDEKRYNQVVEVCALERDFTIFPFGDRTLVGEKGVSLSGGQKARITLARALYRNSDIVLMDDPLSAVDSSVAEHIFEKCIVDYLSDKIRILVTHQIQFIQKATKILVLNEGKCIGLGTYEELQSKGLDFMELLSDNEKNTEKQFEENNELMRSLSQNSYEKQRIKTESLMDSIKSRNKSMSRQSSICLSQSIEVNPTETYQGYSDDPKVQEESREVGSIDSKVYWQYIKAGAGPILGTLTFLSTIISQTIFHSSDLWLTAWTVKNQENEGNIDQNFDIIVYSALIGCLFVTALMRSTTWFTMCMRASVNLHNTIFSRIVRAPISFFDNNPVGRILNRFAKDLGIVDEMLPTTAFDLNLTLGLTIGTLIVVALVNPYLIIPAFVLMIFTVMIRAVYIKSARDIKRFEGLTRSPVFNLVSTTLNGLASVRAFGAQQAFEKQFYCYQDDHSATWFIFLCASRTMGLFMDWFSVGYLFVISIVLMVFYEGIPGGMAGLAFSSAIMLTGVTQWGVRQSAELESQMTSVERIIEYNRLPQEAELTTRPEDRPKDDWPQKGRIEMKNMCVYYDNAIKPVLKNLCCLIKGGEKIGIVGRTGAGKSSIIAALFRMVEPTGEILIDGIDTKSIGLHDLRQKISIIPQDPVVFTGPVRRNLDPFSEFNDFEIWSALEEVQLKNVVTDLPGQLDSELSEGGGNFSVGQRQLVCLARAILRSNKILVLDEATANVDHQTDALIQNTIREKFNDCTVLTIAHRLNTIIDCDRVLVLDDGQILEFDEPLLLFQRKGQFYDMCKKTGRDMFNHLINMAKESHFKKYNTNEVQLQNCE